jgi:hypothetical protein
MKRNLLIALLIGLPSLAISQVSLNASMAPPINVKLIYYDANVPSPPFTFSKSGTTNTWDFSVLTPVAGQDDTTFVVSPSSISGGSSFPTATHCTYEGAVNPSYTMIKVDPFGVTYLGTVADPIGTGNYMPLVIVPPLQVMTFPYTYGSSGNAMGYIEIFTTGASIGQPTLDSVRYKSTNGSVRDVLASGNMILPSGTLPAMLERSVDTQIDSAWGKGIITLNQWVLLLNTIKVDSAFYWYTNQSLLPYAHALYDSTGLHDVNYFKTSSVGISEMKPAASWSIYPNPVVNTLHINSDGNFHGNYELKILNVLGQVVMKGNTSRNQFDVSSLSEGVYILNLVDEEGKTITLKFNKN